MRPVIVFAVLSVTLAACGGGGGGSKPARTAAKPACAPTLGEREQVSPAMTDTPSRVRLGPGDTLRRTPKTLAGARGGRRLVVTGVVSGSDCAPLAGATLNAWQTNAAGVYGPGRDGTNHCCYLQGTVRTDANGRYTLETVMPGSYNGGTPHIHIEVGHPDADGIVTELDFDDGAPRRATFDIVLRRL
jgi:protocatechuate 3,4-dioxygenase beta subunit